MSGRSGTSWREEREGTWIGFLIELARFGVRKLIKDQAPEMAAALAYRTIFSLIPVLVLSLLIVSSFAGRDGIRYGLQRTMEWTGLSEIRVGPEAESEADPSAQGPWQGPASRVPIALDPTFVGPPAPPSDDQQASAELTARLEEFINRTLERFLSINFGIIAIGGIVVLIYGALSLVIQIETAFNTVCRAAAGRKLFQRLVNYWAVLTVGPLGLFLGFAVGDQYKKLLTHLPQWAYWLTTPANYALKIGLSWIILILAYRLMPNTRIRLNAAAIGALLAAMLWEVAKALLTAFVRYLTDPETGGQMAVYGSLALIPLFLLWVYVTWLIILFGLEVTYAVQTVSAGRHVALARLEELPIVEPAIGVLVVRAVAEGFNKGKPCTPDQVAGRVGLAEISTQRVLEHLTRKGFLLRVQDEGGDEVEGYSLARPVEQINPGDLLGAMHELAGELPSNGTGSSDTSILRLLRQSQIEALRTLRVLDSPAATKP